MCDDFNYLNYSKIIVDPSVRHFYERLGADKHKNTLDFANMPYRSFADMHNMMFNTTTNALFKQNHEVDSKLEYKEVSRETLCISLVKYGDNVDWFLI